MSKYLLLYAATVTAILLFLVRHYHSENQRLTENQTTLSTGLEHYRTRWGAEVAAVGVLRLRCAEFERLRASDAEQIRRLGIRLRRVESAARSAVETRIEVAVPLHDTVVARDTVRDTLRFFRWGDAWVEVEGFIERDSVVCRVASVDTLRQVLHRVPRRFLCFRWGTKALRQELSSSNPHSRIVASEYVRIERRAEGRRKF